MGFKGYFVTLSHLTIQTSLSRFDLRKRSRQILIFNVMSF